MSHFRHILKWTTFWEWLGHYLKLLKPKIKPSCMSRDKRSSVFHWIASWFVLILDTQVRTPVIQRIRRFIRVITSCTHYFGILHYICIWRHPLNAFFDLKLSSLTYFLITLKRYWNTGFPPYLRIVIIPKCTPQIPKPIAKIYFLIASTV